MNEQKGILLIDDDTVSLKYALSVLKQQYHVICCKNKNMAMQQLDKHKDIQLILLDVLMPDCDGYELYHTIKTKISDRDIVIAFMTGAEQMEKELEQRGICGVSVLKKPLAADELKMIVSDLLK